MDAIATRYAESIFDLAKEENQIEVYAKDMHLLLQVFNEDSSLVPFFAHVLVNDTEKYEVIDTCFKEHVEEYICNFLKLLVKKRRIRYIKEICIAFKDIYHHHIGVEEGIIYTRFDLGEKEVLRIQEAIGKKEGKKIQLQVVSDASLIGGIKVVLHNQVIDGSIKNQLEILKKELLRK